MKKKILTIVTLLTLALIIFALNVPVMAQEVNKGATVTDDTAEDTKNGDIKAENATSIIEGNTQKLELVYDSADLKVLDGQDGRPAGYAWIGIKVTAPTGAKKCTEDDGTVYDATEFNQYFGVDLAKLKKAVEKGNGYISYTTVYTWDYTDGEEEVANNDRVTTTTLTIKINVEGIKLSDKDGSKSLWNQNEYKTYKMEVELEALKAELEKQGLAQADIEERLQVAEELLAEQDLTIEELKAKIEELTETSETTTEPDTQNTSNEKDNTPKTGSANVALMATVVSAISLAGIVTVKKYTK